MSFDRELSYRHGQSRRDVDHETVGISAIRRLSGALARTRVYLNEYEDGHVCLEFVSQVSVLS